MPEAQEEGLKQRRNLLSQIVRQSSFLPLSLNLTWNQTTIILQGNPWGQVCFRIERFSVQKRKHSPLMPPACCGTALFNQLINISVVKHTNSHPKYDKQAMQSLITGRVKYSHQKSSDWVMFCCQVRHKNIIFRALRISELQIRNMDLNYLPPMVQTTGQPTVVCRPNGACYLFS